MARMPTPPAPDKTLRPPDPRYAGTVACSLCPARIPANSLQLICEVCRRRRTEGMTCHHLAKASVSLEDDERVHTYCRWCGQTHIGGWNP